MSEEEISFASGNKWRFCDRAEALLATFIRCLLRWYASTQKRMYLFMGLTAGRIDYASAIEALNWTVIFALQPEND